MTHPLAAIVMIAALIAGIITLRFGMTALVHATGPLSAVIFAALCLTIGYWIEYRR